MKRSALTKLILLVLLIAVLLLTACTPQPTTEPEGPDEQSRQDQTQGNPDSTTDPSKVDNDAEWQDGWNGIYD